MGDDADAGFCADAGNVALRLFHPARIVLSNSSGTADLILNLTPRIKFLTVMVSEEFLTVR